MDISGTCHAGSYFVNFFSVTGMAYLIRSTQIKGCAIAVVGILIVPFLRGRFSFLGVLEGRKKARGMD